MNILKDHFWTMHAWMVIAVLLTLLEVLLGSSFFLLCVGAACAVVGVVVWLWPSLSMQTQVFMFACAVLGSVGLWWHYLRRRMHNKPEHTTLNRRAEQYIGRTFALSEAIVNGRGRIRVDDSSWQVEGPELPQGTVVEIIGVEGVLLKAKAKV